MFKFIIRVIKKTFKCIKNTLVNIIDNSEAVILLSCSVIGATCLLTELPYVIAMPLWIETPLVVPFLATLFVFILLKSIEFRIDKGLVLCGNVIRL